MKIAVLFIALGISANLEAQTLTKSESAMRDWVRAHTAEELSFLEKVVNISSGTLNQAGVRAVGAEFDKELKLLGFETRWVSMPPEIKRAGHLFAEHKAKRKSRNTGRTVVLLGHLDTVFEGEGQRWTMLDDSTAKGAGSGDM
jgi:Acetylornithine deacetylase/Succinyl-diaminopimelate desuccinylase and related deacylases